MNQKNLQFLTILKIFNEFKAKAKESNFIFPRHRSNSGSLNGLTIELKFTPINLLIPLNQTCPTYGRQGVALLIITAKTLQRRHFVSTDVLQIRHRYLLYRMMINITDTYLQ